MRLSCILISLLLPAQLAIAETEDKPEIVANPNRPTVSNPADITQFGVLELELGADADSTSDDVNLLLKFAVARNLELRFSNLPFSQDRSSGTAGTGDMFAGAQYRFLRQHDSIPSMAVYYGLKIPTATHDQGTGRYDSDILWLVSKDISKTHIDFNVDFQFLGREGEPGHDFVAAPALALSYPLPHNLTLAAEISGTSRQNSDQPATATFLTAISYALRPRLVFDSAVAFGLTGGLPHARYLGGLTYSIADLYHRHGRT